VKTLKLFFFAALLTLCTSVKAQLYTSGEDPGYLKWNYITTDSYKLIFPKGLDSLARVYASTLQNVSRAVGYSIGVEPNQNYRKKMPVILHAYTSDANGMVTWTPRRMELNTVPDAYEADALDWIEMLAIHESRHVSQMQFVNGKDYKPFNILTGQLFSGALAALYPGPLFFEGDAVCAETALTSSGRGRSADFLEYYRASFDEGDFRNWYRWRWGSQKYYTPDYYRLGYLSFAGIRYLYNDTFFTSRYYNRLDRKFIPFFNFQKTVKEVSGKNLRNTWDEIAAAQAEIWKNDKESRAPFDNVSRITPETKRFVEYSGLASAEDGIFAVQSGITQTRRLVRVDEDGTVSALRPFASSSSKLEYLPKADMLFWSETVPHIRWSMASNSLIRTMDSNGKVRTLTKKGRFFNPVPDPDGKLVAACMYPVQGSSAIALLNIEDGTVVDLIDVPDSLQAVEVAWLTKDRLVVSALGKDGFGLYDASGGFVVLLDARPAKIKQLHSRDGALYFVSDRTGVNELYCLNEGVVKQMSNNALGGNDFVFLKDSVYFTSLDTKGRGIYKTSRNEGKIVDYADIYRHPIADRLSSQEAFHLDDLADSCSLGEIKPYRKLSHLMHFHSWLPVYVQYDAISDLSFESVYSIGGLGATLFFQNDLSTSYGTIAYSARPGTGSWQHSVDIKYTYSGLFPVFEFDVNIGGGRTLYNISETLIDNKIRKSLLAHSIDGCNVSGKMKAYVPMNLSRGGWYTGIVPKIDLSISNNLFSTTEVYSRCSPLPGTEDEYVEKFVKAVQGNTYPLAMLVPGIRAYTMLGTASSGIYPRWGVGIEAGYSFRPGIRKIMADNAFAFAYGYIPGILATHGIKWTATVQRRCGDGLFGQNYISTMPRGFEYGAGSSYTSLFPFQSKFTIEYALPFLALDWSGPGPLAYVRNLEAKLHCDCSFYGGHNSIDNCSLYSLGGEMTIRLANLAWIPYDTRIGFSYNYNGSSVWDHMAPQSKNVWKLVFTVDL